jgi:type VI secretion system secreted protein VgrG
MNLKDLAAAFAGLSEADRPIRLRLSYKRRVLDDVLLVKHATGHESLCGGLNIGFYAYRRVAIFR